MPLARRTTTIPVPLQVRPSQKFEGDDGAWSTFKIDVGTPAQSFRVIISTAGSETWVVVPDGCTSTDPSDCASARGAEPFNAQTSNGFATTSSSTWTEVGLYALDLETPLGYSGNGLYGYDVVGLNGGNGLGGISLPNQVVAGIAAKDYFFGVLGLSDRPTSFSSSSKPVNSFMWNLFENKLIPSLSYGYTAGAPYRGKGTYGDLVLGGYDQSRFKPTSFHFSFAASDERPLQLGVQSMTASNTLLGVNSFTTSGGHLSLLDSTVPELWLPQDVADKFAVALGLTYDGMTGRYLINDTMHTRLKSLNPEFTFKLGNTAYDNGNSTNVVVPYAAFDQKIGWPIYNTTQNYFPIRRAANESQYTLGRVLLQEAYLVVDYERRNFTLSQAVFPDPQPEAQIVLIRPPGTDSGSGSKKLATGAIAGIAVGGIALLAIACFLFWFLFWRKRHPKTVELDSKESEGFSDIKDPLKHDGLPPGLSEAPSDSQIVELGANYAHGRDAYAKVGLESQVSELPTPAPVFEMPGDSDYFGAVGTPPRSPGPHSPQQNVRPGPRSPARESATSTPGPSPLGPNRESLSTTLSPSDTWYRVPGQQSPR